jgi:hypothetical protein
MRSIVHGAMPVVRDLTGGCPCPDQALTTGNEGLPHEIRLESNTRIGYFSFLAMTAMVLSR